MKNKIWLSSPHMSGREQKYVQEAFDTNWIAPLGPNVDGFENELSKYLNISNTVVLSSGTAAIHLALIILGIRQYDEVLVSTFTFSATINPIIYQNATPIFIDSEEDTWNMDPELLERAIKDRIKKGKKPKAIILVHLYGMPAKIDEVFNIADKYEIPVIEDAAEALGSKYKNEAVGTRGIFGVLSFNGNKIITTSSGGALVSENTKYIEKARFLATQARDNAPHYQHSHIGYNYRMSNIVAGVGRGQLEVIEKRVESRRNIYKFYKNLLNNFEGIKFLDEINSDFYSNFWLTTILINENKTEGINNNKLRLALEKENIEARPLWKPMHIQPIFKDHPKYLNGISQKLFDIGLCLPSGSNMTDDDKKRIANVIDKVFNKNKI